MKLPVPISSAVASMKWPLSSPSHPMYYEPLSSLQSLRQPNAIPPTMRSIVERGALETIDDLTHSNGNGDGDGDLRNKHHIRVALALIYLGNGLADEAHDLITPLSWGEDTYFGGPTLISHSSSSSSSPLSHQGLDGSDSIVALASYAHSLLHRKEGFAPGEFGMMGYQNANFWANAARSRGGHDSTNSTGDRAGEKDNLGLPFQQVREAVLGISTEFGTDAENWCNRHLLQETSDEIWDIRALHELCAFVSSRDDDDGSDNLKRFAEKASELELRVLLNCCLERAGY